MREAANASAEEAVKRAAAHRNTRARETFNNATVSMLAGLRMSNEEIRGLIINPRTNKPIGFTTLVKAFAHELRTGNAKLKAIIGTRFVEKVNQGDTHSILFGMRAIWGIRDDDPAGSGFAVRVGNGDKPATTINVEFVQPTRRYDDEEPPQPPRALPAPPLHHAVIGRSEISPRRLLAQTCDIALGH